MDAVICRVLDVSIDDQIENDGRLKLKNNVS